MMVVPLVLAVVAALMAVRALQDEARMNARVERTCGESFGSFVRAAHERRLIEARLAQFKRGSSPVRERGSA